MQPIPFIQMVSLPVLAVLKIDDALESETSVN